MPCPLPAKTLPNVSLLFAYLQSLVLLVCGMHDTQVRVIYKCKTCHFLALLGDSAHQECIKAILVHYLEHWQAHCCPIGGPALLP